MEAARAVFLLREIAAASRSKGLLATLGIVAVLLYASLFAIGAIELVVGPDLPVVEPGLNAW